MEKAGCGGATAGEPVFSHELHGIPSDVLNEWLNVLCKRNSVDVQSAKPEQVNLIMK